MRQVVAGVDVTPAVISNTGVSRYARALVGHLADRDDVVIRPFSFGRGHAVPGRRVPVPVRAVHRTWRRLHWPRAELLTGPVDVVHSIDMVPPPTRRPLVVTVHDVLPLTHPQFFPDRSRDAASAQLRGAREAAVVVTTCRATAEAIAEVGGPSGERVVVAAPGCDGPPDDAIQRTGAGTHLLAVGAVTPRKGYDVLARAVTAIGPECPPVLVVGPDWWGADRVRAQVREADRFGRIRFLGEVDDATLARLYAEALLFCFPTLAEGFGIPCLEALGFGAAVVASDLPPLREIAADAARLVPPGDSGALAEAISELLGDDGERERLASRGPSRASAFTWAGTAAGVAGAYHRAAS